MGRHRKRDRIRCGAVYGLVYGEHGRGMAGTIDGAFSYGKGRANGPLYGAVHKLVCGIEHKTGLVYGSGRRVGLFMEGGGSERVWVRE